MNYVEDMNLKNTSNFYKFMAVTATAVVATAALAPQATAKTFPDVPSTHEFAPYIDALSDAGIINGKADGKFYMSENVTRGQVAIMLGRWLETNGYAAPEDWNLKQYFTDIPVDNITNNNKDLVKYAALVKSAGVFTGSNGKLNASANINRQNMSKVLNNAYELVNGMDLIAISKSKSQVKVNDLSKALTENRPYIQALANLGITTVSNYNPAGFVKRGQFAKFLYLTSNVEPINNVAKVTAINETTIRVQFDNGFQQDIQVNALKPNVATEVTFKIDGETYKRTVTYKK